MSPPEGSWEVTVLQEATHTSPGAGTSPALGAYPGTGILPLLANKDVQRVILLQVEDAQDRHAVRPHHGVLPAFPTSCSVA